MNSEKKMAINIFDYTDYRRYLADYYKLQKVINPVFSYRFFARRADIKSSGLYKELVDGKRNLTRALIEKFSSALGHTKRECEYFQGMVQFNEAQSLEERKIFFRKMMAVCDNKVYRVRADQYEYFSKWYYVAIREILALIRFKDDYENLAIMVQPRIRADQAKKAIVILERLKLIEKDEEGYYSRTDNVVSTGYMAESKAVGTMNLINFQKVMMHLAQSSYENFELRDLDMSTLTFSVSEETYKAIKEELAAFRSKILSMASKDQNPDRVYHLNNHLFPLAYKKQTNSGAENV